MKALKKNKLLLLPIIAGVIAVLSFTAVIVVYQKSDVVAFGHETNAFTLTLDFQGDEISDYAALENTLSQFHNLWRVNLGSYPISVNQLTELSELHPKTKFACDTFVNLHGMIAETNATELDFTDYPITDGSTLKKELSNFPYLYKVTFGENTIPLEDRRALQTLYPSIIFDCVSTVNLSGQDVREDAEEAKLEVESLDGKELLKKLVDLPNLKKLSCHSAAIPLEQCEELAQKYPDIEFSLAGEFEMYGKKFRTDDKSIDLSKVKLNDHLEDDLKIFTNLEKVDLHGQPINREKQVSLAKAYPDVLFGWMVEIADVEADSFDTELILDGHPIGEMEKFHESLMLLPNLDLLQMCDCGISNEDMAALRSQYPNTEVVWRVYLGKWSMLTNAEAFSVQIWKYDYRRMTSADIQVLKYCNKLKALDVGHQAITDISVIGDYLPELRVLILADNAVSDLTPLSKLKHLHYLEVFLNRIRDLSPLAECTEMVDLNVSYNYGIWDVSPISNFPMMERLWMEHTSISYGSFMDLQGIYPDATLVLYGTGSVDHGWRTHERYYAMQDSYHNNYLSESFSRFG